jgi:DNA-binding FadR family transcriptional regulator
MEFVKVSSPVLSDVIVRQLLERIGRGEFPPGSKLPSEMALSGAFGVSRTVLREAIQQLRNEGVVQSWQGRGIFVSTSNHARPLRIDADDAALPGNIFHLLSLRRAIETEIAREAALHRTDADLAEIERALAAIEEDVARGSDGVDADIEFHRAIARASGNPYFMKTLDFVGKYIESATRVTRDNEAHRIDFAHQVRDEHGEILRAIRQGNAAVAGTAARRHMLNAARRLRLSGIV